MVTDLWLDRPSPPCRGADAVVWRGDHANSGVVLMRSSGEPFEGEELSTCDRDPFDFDRRRSCSGVVPD
ncbi:hypothetical protein TNCV_4868981 [Trichonephila clavipes]|nr:hypothetical protein TNCV_4868981 [Trichonephila clavipes]